MERDRAAVLTLRSAVLGVVDYRDADWHSPMWWKRWRYLVQTMDDQSYEKVLENVYKFQLALVSNSRISSEDFSKVQREAQELFKDIEGCMRPWLGRSREDRQAQESKTFREQWKAVAGFDPADPEAKAKWAESIRDTLAEIKADKEAVAAKAKEQEDLIRQRMEQVRRKRLTQQGRK